jgi:glutamine synthetase
MLCSFIDKDGQPLESAPEHTLYKASKAFTKVTGMEFHAMGELEYYVIAPDTNTFPATDQHGYHESAPYAKTNDFRTKCMSYIAQAGGHIKYGHSEVGNFTLGGLVYEQNEIEFLPVRVEEAADQLMIAKWVIRNLGYKLGYNITFAPKITTGKAGSGLHIHMRMMKDGKNCMLDNGVLSDKAKTAIAGMMELAQSITAFGNKNPTSYFRLVPHQEAPTNVCWGDRNRSVLVRVPLGWSSKIDMCRLVNELEGPGDVDTTQKQTVEMRSPDGSADIYQLLAGLCVACRHGFEIEHPLEIAEKTYVNVNIHEKENADKLKMLAQLPDSCAASADCLERQRSIFEEYNVFSPSMIDGILTGLRSFKDRTLREDIQHNPDEVQELVTRYFHCG